MAFSVVSAWEIAIKVGRKRVDRMLVAQAQIEALAILTADPTISRYDVETIW